MGCTAVTFYCSFYPPLWCTSIFPKANNVVCDVGHFLVRCLSYRSCIYMANAHGFLVLLSLMVCNNTYSTSPNWKFGLSLFYSPPAFYKRGLTLWYSLSFDIRCPKVAVGFQMRILIVGSQGVFICLSNIVCEFTVHNYTSKL